jgi:hypothetical protein
MSPLALHELSGKTGLLIRETADDALSKVSSESLAKSAEIEVDFENVLAVSPSFMDQLIRGIRKMLPLDLSDSMILYFHKVPTQPSEKFVAVGRAHGLVLKEVADGEWLMTPRPSP